MLCANVAQLRIIFLSQLLHEGRSHLQQHLTASVLGRKVFVMPFHRGIQLTPHALGAMKAALAYCQKVRLQSAYFTQRTAVLAKTKKHGVLTMMLAQVCVCSTTTRTH